MKKNKLIARAVILVLAVVMLLSMVACGDTKKPEKNEDTTTVADAGADTTARSEEITGTQPNEDVTTKDKAPADTNPVKEGYGASFGDDYVIDDFNTAG